MRTRGGYPVEVKGAVCTWRRTKAGATGERLADGAANPVVVGIGGRRPADSDPRIEDIERDVDFGGMERARCGEQFCQRRPIARQQRPDVPCA